MTGCTIAFIILKYFKLFLCVYIYGLCNFSIGILVSCCVLYRTCVKNLVKFVVYFWIFDFFSYPSSSLLLMTVVSEKGGIFYMFIMSWKLVTCYNTSSSNNNISQQSHQVLFAVRPHPVPSATNTIIITTYHLCNVIPFLAFISRIYKLEFDFCPELV